MRACLYACNLSEKYETFHTYAVRLLSLSRAAFARCLRQQITSKASKGNPNMQVTIGITIFSGATANSKMKQCDKIFIVREHTKKITIARKLSR